MESETGSKVRSGYEQLAFGGIEDAVRLLFAEELSPRVLKGMNLFNISEIKRQKGGGMEIKFFDRIKALQCMEGLDTGPGKADRLLYALENSMKSLSEKESEEQAPAQQKLTQSTIRRYPERV